MKADHSFEKHHRLVREVIETVVLTVLMFIIINLAVQNYDVTGPSMEPTLHNQERIMVDKVSYRFHEPARGDVIVFIAPPHPELNYVKRIIATPGDELTVDNTTVTVNGATLNEKYVVPERQGNPNITKYYHRVLPANEYFVMGDDRINSSDSREWGLVPLPEGRVSRVRERARAPEVGPHLRRYAPASPIQHKHTDAHLRR